MSFALVMRLRLELYAAAQLLQGEDLASFTELIGEIHGMLEIMRPKVLRIEVPDGTRVRRWHCTCGGYSRSPDRCNDCIPMMDMP